MGFNVCFLNIQALFINVIFFQLFHLEYVRKYYRLLKSIYSILSHDRYLLSYCYCGSEYIMSCQYKITLNSLF